VFGGNIARANRGVAGRSVVAGPSEGPQWRTPVEDPSGGAISGVRAARHVACNDRTARPDPRDAASPGILPQAATGAWWAQQDTNLRSADDAYRPARQPLPAMPSWRFFCSDRLPIPAALKIDPSAFCPPCHAGPGLRRGRLRPVSTTCLCRSQESRGYRPEPAPAKAGAGMTRWVSPESRSFGHLVLFHARFQRVEPRPSSIHVTRRTIRAANATHP
jgi:hypothetical protein